MKFKKILLILMLLLIINYCLKFKENPLDPTTPLGYYLTFILNQKEKKLKIFITARTVDGKLENSSESFTPVGSNAIEKADYICKIDANKPDNSYYKAMLSDYNNTIWNRRACTSSDCTDPGENIDWVFKPNTSYYRVDGTYLFTTNSAGIVPSTESIANPIADTNYQYWTGLEYPPNAWKSASYFNGFSTYNCYAWTDNISSNDGFYGQVQQTYKYSWFTNDYTGCSTYLHLLCVEQ